MHGLEKRLPLRFATLQVQSTNGRLPYKTERRTKGTMSEESANILLSEWQYWSQFKSEASFQVTAFRQTLRRIMNSYEEQKKKLQELLDLLPQDIRREKFGERWNDFTLDIIPCQEFYGWHNRVSTFRRRFKEFIGVIE